MMYEVFNIMIKKYLNLKWRCRWARVDCSNYNWKSRKVLKSQYTLFSKAYRNRQEGDAIGTHSHPTFLSEICRLCQENLQLIGPCNNIIMLVEYISSIGLDYYYILVHIHRWDEESNQTKSTSITRPEVSYSLWHENWSRKNKHVSIIFIKHN